MIQILLIFLLFFTIAYIFFNYIHVPKDGTYMGKYKNIHKRAKINFAKVFIEDVIKTNNVKSHQTYDDDGDDNDHQHQEDLDDDDAEDSM
jgi:hypothetical protein